MSFLVELYLLHHLFPRLTYACHNGSYITRFKLSHLEKGKGDTWTNNIWIQWGLAKGKVPAEQEIYRLPVFRPGECGIVSCFSQSPTLQWPGICACDGYITRSSVGPFATEIYRPARMKILRTHAPSSACKYIMF